MKFRRQPPSGPVLVDTWLAPLRSLVGEVWPEATDGFDIAGHLDSGGDGLSIGASR
jgi:hypothetical protein